MAHICLRVNPNVGAHTHANITTGLSENKFGIDFREVLDVAKMANALPAVEFMGLHFHIGSQILEMHDFELLCMKINELQDTFENAGIKIKMINVGGGLGVSYAQPEEKPFADFSAYFNTYTQHLRLRKGQTVHFELGRAIVAQCGSLIARVLYIKKGVSRNFVILDAGMTELIRPALYEAHHQIVNLCNQNEPRQKYDVVGPVCESSDYFAHDALLPTTQRGDLIAIRSAGAYGESMASQYNGRALAESYTADELCL